MQREKRQEKGFWTKRYGRQKEVHEQRPPKRGHEHSRILENKGLWSWSTEFGGEVVRGKPRGLEKGPMLMSSSRWRFQVLGSTKGRGRGEQLAPPLVFVVLCFIIFVSLTYKLGCREVGSKGPG